MTEGSVTTRGFLELVQDRRSLYGWLGPIYTSLPDLDFAEILLGENFHAVISGLLSRTTFPMEMAEGVELIDSFLEDSRGLQPEELQRSLSAEFTRLFRATKKGRGPPPPYESVYLEQGLVMGRLTAEVAREYSKEGISIREDLRSEPPDHVGLELDFMRHLCAEEEEAWASEQMSRAVEYLEKEAAFLLDHVVRWVPAFCDEVIRFSEKTFYAGAARMTKGFVLWDSDQLATILEAAKSTQNKRA